MSLHLHDQLVKKSSQALQMWNLQDADIRAVIQIISRLTGKNFIIDPRVQGKITVISNRPISVNEMYRVFLSMLQVLNYAAIPSGNIIKIVPSMQAKEYGGVLSSAKNPGHGDQVVVRVVPVNNISATQLVPVLRPLMEEWGNISAYDPSNTLILAGSASNINRIVSIVHRMDQKNANNIQVVQLKYANAKKLVSVVNALQTADRTQGKVSNVSLVADEENNTILVSGNTLNRQQTYQLIQKLDTRDANGGIDTVVLHLNYLKAKTLPPILTKVAHGKVEQQNQKSGKTSTFGVGGSSSSNISIQAENNDNAIIISAPTAMVRNLQGIVKELDVQPQQVLVQAIIVEMDENLVNQLGIQWGLTDSSGNFQSGTISGGVSYGNQQSNQSNQYNQSGFDQGDNGYNNSVPTTFMGNGSGGMGFIANGNLSVVIHALNRSPSTNVLSTPSIVVLNNQKASISDGQNVGIMNRSYEGTGSAMPGGNSTLPFNTFQRKDVTLSLNVTPQITPNGVVSMKIDQQNNQLAADATSSPDNPTINTTKIKTNVLVNSGDILVLGGLIKNSDEEGEEKVPILGDIPILGNLFRYKTKNKEKKDLMVFIRPVILHSRKDIKSQTMKDYNYMRYQELRKRAGLKMDMGDQPLLPSRGKPNLVSLPPPFPTRK